MVLCQKLVTTFLIGVVAFEANSFQAESSLISRFGSKSTCFLFLLAFFLALRHRKLFFRKLPTPLEVVKSLSDTDWSIWLWAPSRMLTFTKYWCCRF